MAKVNADRMSEKNRNAEKKMSETVSKRARGFGRIGVQMPLIVGTAMLALAVAVGAAGYMVASNTVHDLDVRRLENVAQARATEVAGVLDRVRQDLRFMSQNRMIQDAAAAFTLGFGQIGDKARATLQQAYIHENPYPVGEKQKLDAAPGAATYNISHRIYHPSLRAFQEERGYYDVFLFNLQGDLVYSVFKEADFATNFVRGQWQDSGLGQAYRNAVKASKPGQVSFVDFAAYGPSNDAPASFVAAPVFVNGEKAGVLAVQMPTGPIQAIADRDTGLGQTAETILVGSDGLMRVDSARTTENDLLRAGPEYAEIANALAGKTAAGEEVAADGTDLFVGAAPMTFEGLRWAVVTQVETDEILGPVAEMRNAFLLVGGVALVVLLCLVMYFTRRMVIRMQRLSETVGHLAAGENNVAMPGLDQGDELGDIARALTEIDHANVRTLRLKSALDNCQTNVMVADTDYNIVYVNRTMLEMLENAEADIRKDLPRFEAKKIVGANIDGFHRNPAHQRHVLDSLTQKHDTSLAIGGRFFDLVVSPTFNSEGERVGTVVEWADVTEKRAREEMERLAANENLRIRSALDNTQTNVMVADADLKIVYGNHTLFNMLRNAEADIRSELPQFSVDSVVGSTIDIFHKKPEHQRGMLARLNGTHHAAIAVGGRNFNLAVSPIMNDAKERVGFVVEWADVTAERAIEGEIDNVVAAAVQGDFTRRLSLDDKHGFQRNLAAAMNRLCETTSDAINAVAGSLSALAEGDLTRQVEGDYTGLFGKLRDDTNATSSQLSRIVTDIIAAADEVSAAADEISSGTTDLSSRTEQQASNLEETAASMEEMASTIKQNAENAQQANQLSTSARDVAMRGGSIVENAISAMSRIEESSQKVSDIIGVIDEIAFQTNLLALNAAVEAARAGDAGKGFAVVASEVRTLAQRSSQAAKDIKGLIVDSGAQVKDGVSLVNDTGKSLEEIVTSIKRLSDIVSEISAASNEQATGVEEINRAVSQMDEMTQQNAALVEENAAAAKTLLEQSRGMRQRMTYFTVGGVSSAADFGQQVKASFEARVDPARTAVAASRVKKVATGGAGPVAIETEDDGWDEF